MLRDLLMESLKETLKVRIEEALYKTSLGSMNNHFKSVIDETITGIKVLLGPYTIHLVEGDSNSVKKVLHHISNNMNGNHPFYNNAWVLHFVDEVPNKIFNQWFCKSVSIGGTGKDMKNITSQMDKAYTIYEAMCEIGKQLTSKGYSTATHQPSQI